MREDPWKTLSSDLRYENAWIRVVEHQVITPAGARGIYGTVHFRKAGAAIVPIDAEGFTWLVGQHRFPLGRFSWELPVGGVEAGESPQEAAARELAEEVGLSATGWRPLLEADHSCGVTDEAGYAFLAWGLSPVPAAPQPDESLEVRRLPFQQALQMIDRGELRDLLSVAALLRVRVLALEGDLPPPLLHALARSAGPPPPAPAR